MRSHGMEMEVMQVMEMQTELRCGGTALGACRQP